MDREHKSNVSSSDGSSCSSEEISDMRKDDCEPAYASPREDQKEVVT